MQMLFWFFFPTLEHLKLFFLQKNKNKNSHRSLKKDLFCFASDEGWCSLQVTLVIHHQCGCRNKKTVLSLKANAILKAQKK